MTTILQVSQVMQKLLREVANEAGLSSGFIQRQRKLSGVSFVQTAVFGWMANPQASLEEWSQAAATCGVAISGQGLDQRFTAAASICLKQVLEASMTMLVGGDGGAVALFECFQGVYYWTAQWWAYRPVCDHIVRVSVGEEHIVFSDEAPLPAGTISFSLIGNGPLRVDDFQLWFDIN